MHLLEVVPGLAMLPLGISNAYLWHDPGGVTLIDTGRPGSAPAIKAAMQDLGLPREELRRIVLIRFHRDHAGSAAELGPTGSARRSSPERTTRRSCTAPRQSHRSPWRSLERLAAMDIDVACFGHGEPIIGAAHQALRRVTNPLG